MIRPKAPKDMTAPELVDYLQKRVHERVTDKTLINDGSMTAAFIVAFAKGLLSEPAPNPFTPDQVAWMREERRTGMAFAWHARNGYVFCSSELPEVKDGDLRSLAETHSAHKNNFLSRILDVNEYIVLSVYAPMEGEGKC